MCMHTCMYTHTSVYAFICVYIYAHLHKRMYTYMHIYIDTYVNLHLRIHIHILLYILVLTSSKRCGHDCFEAAFASMAVPSGEGMICAAWANLRAPPTVIRTQCRNTAVGVGIASRLVSRGAGCWCPARANRDTNCRPCVAFQEKCGSDKWRLLAKPSALVGRFREKKLALRSTLAAATTWSAT